jgi:hypothetical protein
MFCDADTDTYVTEQVLGNAGEMIKLYAVDSHNIVCESEIQISVSDRATVMFISSG